MGPLSEQGPGRTPQRIRDLFAQDIGRRIEEVVKADQDDPATVAAEIEEYVVTDTLAAEFATVLERYAEAALRPTEGVGVWISGFFGSGKSSFAKVLGHILENRDLGGLPSSVAFARRLRPGSERLQVLLRQINERIPTTSVIVDVLTERNVTRPNEPVSLILYRALLRRLGFSPFVDIAELEFTLIRTGRYTEFRDRFQEAFATPWTAGRELVAFSRQQASRIVHEMDPATYPTPDSYFGLQPAPEMNTRWLAQRFLDLLEIGFQGHRLVLVADEVGQYVGGNLPLIQDVQGLAHSIGQAGAGRLWLVATSQERLDEVVGGLERTSSDLSRLQDRFPTRIDLAPKDITEVAALRVLAKRPDATARLEADYAAARANLEAHARFSGTGRAGGWDARSFAAFYPLLPDRAQLLVAAVDGLRSAGPRTGGSGGSHRTLIKLTQQAVVHARHGVGEAPVGRLFTLDRAYGLLEGSFPSEMRREIHEVRTDRGPDSLAGAVMAAVAVLQMINDLPGTAANVAAALHPDCGAPGRQAEVEAVLEELVESERLRRVGQRYEVITGAGRDWQQRRRGIDGTSALPGLRTEFVREALRALPPYRHRNLRNFSARVRVGQESPSPGDLPLVVRIDEADALAAASADIREASRAEPNTAFWTVPAGADWDRALEEVHRSREMLRRHPAGAPAPAGPGQGGSPQEAERLHLEDVLVPAARRATTAALLSGTVHVGGVPRPARQWGNDPAQIVLAWLARQIPLVFGKFDLAAVPAQAGDARRLIIESNLASAPVCAGPPPAGLGLVLDRAGGLVIDVSAPAAAAVHNRLRTAPGPIAGKQLESEYRAAPYGWDLEALMVVTAALFRAGEIEAVAAGQSLRSGDAAASAIFAGPAPFRAATFRLRQGGLSIGDLATAAMALEGLGGRHVGLEEGAILATARQLANEWRTTANNVRLKLQAHHWPTSAAPDEILRLTGSWPEGRADAVLRSVLEAAEALPEALAALTAIDQATSGTALTNLEKAWALRAEAGQRAAQGLTDATVEAAASALGQLLDTPEFHLHLPEIQGGTATLQTALDRQATALKERLAQAAAEAADGIRTEAARLGASPEQAEPVLRPVLALGSGLPTLSVPETARRLAGIPEARSAATAALARLLRPSGQQVPVRVREVLPTVITAVDQLEPALDTLRQRCTAILREGGTVVIE